MKIQLKTFAMIFSFVFIFFNIDAQTKIYQKPSGSTGASSNAVINIYPRDFEKYFDDFVVDAIFKYWDKGYWDKEDFQVVVTENAIGVVWDVKVERERRLFILERFSRLPNKQPVIDKYMNKELFLNRILPTGVVVLLLCIFIFYKKQKIG